MYVKLGVLVGLGILGSSATGRAESKNEAHRHTPSHESSKAKHQAKLAVRRSRDSARLFRALDADSDGVITHHEFWEKTRAYVARRVKQRFEKLDRNQDGKLLFAEVPTMDPERFARFDVNGDNMVTAFELMNVMHRQAAQRARLVFARLDQDGDNRCSAFELDHERMVLAQRRQQAPSTERQEVAEAETAERKSGNF